MKIQNVTTYLKVFNLARSWIISTLSWWHHNNIQSYFSDRTFNPTTRMEWMFYQKNMTVCYCRVIYTFQSESTLYNCLNARELLAWNRCDIWSLSDSKGIWTHNHLVHKRTLNHLAKLVIWLNGWVFVYELSGCRFESRCCQKTIIWNPFSAFLWKKYHYSIIVKIKFVL